MSSPVLRHYDADGARGIREIVALIHRDAYARRIATGDLFASEDAFMKRFDAYVQRPDFDLVLAYLDDEPVGQSWGWPLGERTAWWNGILEEPEPGFTREDGRRTFVVAEIMVRQKWTGQGIAHALHNELLKGRREARAALLVRPNNTAAYSAYTRWGWRKVAQLSPQTPHAPLFDVLILNLPREK